MRKKFPNTEHWQVVVAVGRRIYGRGWRRGLEKFFGIERGGLRALIDRADMTDEQRRASELRMIQILAYYENIMATRLCGLERMREKITAARDERERQRLRAALKSRADSEFAEVWVGTCQESLARQAWPEIFNNERAA